MLKIYKFIFFYCRHHLTRSLDIWHYRRTKIHRGIGPNLRCAVIVGLTFLSRTGGWPLSTTPNTDGVCRVIQLVCLYCDRPKLQTPTAICTDTHSVMRFFLITVNWCLISTSYDNPDNHICPWNVLGIARTKQGHSGTSYGYRWLSGD